MKYLHTMVRVEDIDKSLDFYCNKLGLKEIRRRDSEKGRFTLIFLGAENSSENSGLLELTYNWDSEKYTGGRNFGHLAYSVKNIYETCEKLMANDVVINRPPRDSTNPIIIPAYKHPIILPNPPNATATKAKRAKLIPTSVKIKK